MITEIFGGNKWVCANDEVREDGKLERKNPDREPTKGFTVGTLSLSNSLLLPPLSGVSSYPFRRLCREKGAALTFCEMVSSNGLMYGDERSWEILDIGEGEEAGVQIFGSDPQVMGRAAEDIVSRKSPAVVDINVGCPVKKVVGKGAGAALMKEPAKAAAVIRRVAEAVSGKAAVSVKMRSGWDEDHVNAPQIGELAERAGVDMVSVHGRTRRQMYKGEVDLDVIRDTVRALDIPVVGNGDVDSYEKTKEMLNYTGCEGVMIGRASFGNPWIFERILKRAEGQEYEPPSCEEIIGTIFRHLDMLKEIKPEAVAIREMRKHVGWYAKGFYGATRLRERIQKTETENDFKQVLGEYLQKLQERRRAGDTWRHRLKGE